MELLAVMVIIGLLVVLLFPSMLQLISATKETKCLYNVRTLLGATFAYCADHGGNYPALKYDEKADGTIDQDSGGVSLCVILHPEYVKNKSMRCPLITPSHIKDPKLLGYKYAINAGLLRSYPTSTAQLPVAAYRVALISELMNDTAWTTVSHLNTTMNKGKLFGDDVAWNYQFHGSKEHRGLNMGFLDGHVQLVKPDNNDFGSKSATYGNATNSGFFYSSAQFEAMKANKNGEYP